jgi:hypothetical protein
MKRIYGLCAVTLTGAFAIAGCGTEAADPEPAADVGRDAACGDARCAERCRMDGDCGGGAICQNQRCTSGCRDPADCPAGHTCQNQICLPISCRLDSECGSGDRCDQGVCTEVGAGRCEDDTDCGHRWHCLSEGRCHDVACVAHTDCSPEQWCHADLCVPRSGRRGEVRFERLSLPPLDAHITPQAKTYGPGGALFDLDSDGDEDIFLGGSDPGARPRASTETSPSPDRSHSKPCPLSAEVSVRA